MTLIVPKRTISRPRGSFAFPGTNPGFDPSHPASLTTRVSLVSIPNPQGLDCLTGRVGSLLSSPTFSIDGAIGPSLVTTTNNGVTYTVPAAAAATPQTYAAIFQLASVGGNFQYACGIGGGNGSGIGVNSTSGPIFLRNGATSYQPGGYTFVAGVPYFMIGSSDNATFTNVLVRRLDNGTRAVFSGAGSNIIASNTTLYYGNASSGAFALKGRIACAMYSEVALPMAILTKWADDPWGFWYPR